MYKIITLLLIILPANLIAQSATDILLDRKNWNKASEKQQDLAIKEVAEILGNDYQHVSTKLYKCNRFSHRIATFRHKVTGALLNLIPGGTYEMGSHSNSSIDEKPVHEVTIKPFLIGKFEIRQKVWDSIGGDDGRRWRGEDLPIEKVSWHSVRRWCEHAEGKLRLPSEAEWEYAARAGSPAYYFWGNNKVDKSYVWYRGNAKGKAHPVTEHEKQEKWNSFGLIDILGNVYEWVEDDYIRDYKEGPYDNKPRKTKRVNKKIIRGGCWLYPPRNTLTCADRNYYRPAGTDSIMGFRVARSLKLK